MEDLDTSRADLDVEEIDKVGNSMSDITVIVAKKGHGVENLDTDIKTQKKRKTHIQVQQTETN